MEYLLLFQLIITEIHPTPSAGEPEWIECTLQGGSNLRLSSFMLCDNRTCIRLPNVTVQENAIIVLTRDAAGLREARNLADSVIVIEAALPSLGNTTDRVQIRTVDSSIIDEIAYTIQPAQKGRSIERHGRAMDQYIKYDNEWSSSIAFDSATCGRVNSRVQYDDDLGVTGMFVQDSLLNVGLQNVGLRNVPSSTIYVAVGTYDTLCRFPELSPGAWWSLSVPLAVLCPREHLHSDTIRATIERLDNRSENNIFVDVIDVPPIAGNIMISEVLADSRDRDCDFVEIWNGTNDTLDLAGWSIEDDGGSVCRVSGPAIVAPQGFIACASDSAIQRMAAGAPYARIRPVLNVNAVSDSIILRTAQGFMVDAVRYDHKMHNEYLKTSKGRSLEKRSLRALGSKASSWASSTHMDGCTPGRPNSMQTLRSETQDLLRASPSPFSTLPHSSRYPCVVSWSQPFEQAYARLVIVGRKGEFVAELLNGELIGHLGEVVWDGTHMATSSAAPVGMYIGMLECIDANSSSVVRSTCPIVIGESR